MFFILSKILGFLINPFNGILILLLGGLALLLKRPAAGRKVIFTGVILLYICGLNPVPRFFIAPLENRIPAPTLSDEFDGIIVLTGMVNMQCSRSGLVELNSSADRIINGVILAQKYSRAQLIFTGGTGSLIQDENLKEADFLKRLSIDLGISEKKIVIENASRNTHEHTEELAFLLSKERIWVLVTSAYHMPRALGCFRKAGFTVIPFPVDYQNNLEHFNAGSDPGNFWPSIKNYLKFNKALHEYAGLLVYSFLGYTDSLFPKI